MSRVASGFWSKRHCSFSESLSTIQLSKNHRTCCSGIRRSFRYSVCSGHRIKSSRSKWRAARPLRSTLIEEFIRQNTADLTGPSLTAEAIRTGQSQMISVVTDQWMEDYTLGRYDMTTLKMIGTKSMGGRAAQRIMGKASARSASGRLRNRRIYDHDDLIFFEELGRRCSTALLNASLFREARRAIGARDDFISIASHELKTPLTSLYLHLRLLSRAYQKMSAKSSRHDSNGTVGMREMEQNERQADRADHTRRSAPRF